MKREVISYGLRIAFLIQVSWGGIACFSPEDLPLPPSLPGQEMGSGGGGGADSTSGSSSGDATMCNDVNEVDGDSCTADLKCGVDYSVTISNPIFAKAIAFHATDDQSSCYLWVKFPTNWDTANKLCPTGMRLAVFKSWEHLNTIRTGLLKNPASGGMPGEEILWTWVGAQRKAAPNSQHWSWIDGTALATCTDSTCIWGKGEPNDMAEGCAEIRRKDDDNTYGDGTYEKNGRLNDASCWSISRFFLCQRQPPPQP